MGIPHPTPKAGPPDERRRSHRQPSEVPPLWHRPGRLVGSTRREVVVRHGGNGRAPRRVGGWYLALVVLGTVGALAFAWNAESEQAKVTASFFATLGPLYLAWATFRHDQVASATVDLDTAAAQLSIAVGKQWNDEAANRRMNDPYPLPVAWTAADTDLVEPWPLLEDMARAWPGGPPADPAQWPQDSTGLAGADAQISEVFTTRVPTRRLVVLGEPGSGKTMLLIRLLQHLNTPHTPGSPVPVLFALASWNPADQSLNDWLATQLRQSYPGLRAPAPGQQSDLAQALLDAGRILPLLDGFDELPPALHDMGFNALNRDLAAKAPVVLASRAAAYRHTVTRPDAMVRLNGAAGIHLLPLTPQDAEAYLRRDAGGPHSPAANRWDTVATQLGTNTPVGQVLGTPLGLFLARTIYNPRPNTTPPPDGVPHPDELCAFPTQTDLNAHLFNAFIPAAYAPHDTHPRRWKPEQAHRTHVFLARHLENNRNGNPNLAWWELPLTIRRSTLRTALGLTTGLLFGIIYGLPYELLNVYWDNFRLPHGIPYGPWDRLPYGISVGLLVGIAFGLTRLSLPDPGTPGVRRRWSTRSFPVRAAHGFVTMIAIAIAFPLLNELAAGFPSTYSPEDEFLTGLLIGLPFGLARLPAPHPGTPSVRLRWSTRSFLTGLGFGPLAGIVFGLVLWIRDGFVDGFVYGFLPGLVIGLVFGIMAGLVYGFRAVRPELTTVVGPVTLHYRDRRTFIATVLGIGLVFGLALGLLTGFLLGLTSPQAFVLELAAGLLAGLVFALAHTVYAGFTITVALLALRRRVPRNLIAFLQDAHENRGVLRQVGAVYQFRHLDLQRHLAETTEPHTTQPEPAPLQPLTAPARTLPPLPFSPNGRNPAAAERQTNSWRQRRAGCPSIQYVWAFAVTRSRTVVMPGDPASRQATRARSTRSHSGTGPPCRTEVHSSPSATNSAKDSRSGSKRYVNGVPSLAVARVNRAPGAVSWAMKAGIHSSSRTGGTRSGRSLSAWAVRAARSPDTGWRA
ncbi:NACHT domain-containing protein [Streptomyces sp. AJS327]|nr:NACHT domain-containing protein [Streptomyces sp. AJS327]